MSLTSPTGAAVWKHEPLSSPAVNEDLALALPDLPAGQYQLEIVVLSRGEQIRKRVSSLFIARDSYAISGIKSFPPVITTGSTVLLKAELAVPDGSDPYLRWTWKGKLIARGLRSGGAAQALWSAPAEEGVYSIHLELFPGAPATGADFTFSSSLIQSTDLYVTAGTHLARGDLSPEKSYWSLLHLQGNLADAGAGAKPGKSDASPIGSPQVVQVADGFGYRLDGRSGIAIPWLILPVEAGALAPFTITMGITPESFECRADHPGRDRGRSRAFPAHHRGSCRQGSRGAAHDGRPSRPCDSVAGARAPAGPTVRGLPVHHPARHRDSGQRGSSMGSRSRVLPRRSRSVS